MTFQAAEYDRPLVSVGAHTHELSDFEAQPSLRAAAVAAVTNAPLRDDPLTKGSSKRMCYVSGLVNADELDRGEATISFDRETLVDTFLNHKSADPEETSSTVSIVKIELCSYSNNFPTPVAVYCPIVPGKVYMLSGSKTGGGRKDRPSFVLEKGSKDVVEKIIFSKVREDLINIARDLTGLNLNSVLNEKRIPIEVDGQELHYMIEEKSMLNKLLSGLAKKWNWNWDDSLIMNQYRVVPQSQVDSFIRLVENTHANVKEAQHDVTGLTFNLKSVAAGSMSSVYQDMNKSVFIGFMLKFHFVRINSKRECGDK